MSQLKAFELPLPLLFTIRLLTHSHRTENSNTKRHITCSEHTLHMHTIRTSFNGIYLYSFGWLFCLQSLLLCVFFSCTQRMLLHFINNSQSFNMVNMVVYVSAGGEWEGRLEFINNNNKKAYNDLRYCNVHIQAIKRIAGPHIRGKISIPK